MELYCRICGRETVSWKRLCLACLASIREGVKALKEGRVTSWEKVKKDLAIS